MHFRESSKCPNPSVSPPPPQSLPLGGVAAERSSGLRRRRCRRQSSKFPNPRQSPLPRWPRVTALRNLRCRAQFINLATLCTATVHSSCVRGVLCLEAFGRSAMTTFVLK